MGNSLCKEPRGGSSMRPGRVFDSFGNIMCPNGLRKNKHGINKTYLSRHVLETTSKTNTLNNWNITPKDSPDSAKVIDTPPVAPPRKKRTTLERETSPEAMLKVKNGFKDVFGAESRRQSYDIVAKRKPSDTVDRGLPAMAASSFAIDVKDEEFSDFSKVPTKAEMDAPKEDPTQNGSAKVSRVGNKKSDKFFGENLSDALSDDPVVIERRKSAKKELPDLDKIDQFIEKHVLNVAAKSDAQEVPKIQVTEPDAKIEHEKPIPESSKAQNPKDILDKDELNEKNFMKYLDESVGNGTSLGKKAEFLMAMLEDYPNNRYQGMTPVEEPVIVPRKRKTRHICDKDEHMHNVLHKHDHEVDSSKNLITTEASIETPPRKPDRDFSRYLAPTNNDNDDSDDSCSSRPIRKRNTLQTPPSPPFRHRMPKSLSETEFHGNLSDTTTSTPKKLDAPVEVKAHSPRTLKRIISMPTSIGMVKTETRTPSPRPVLLKSSSSSSFLIMDLHQAHMKVVPFTPQDPCHNADDLVKPKSRLVMRKTSTKSSDGASCTATPTLELPSLKFTIGSSEVLNSPPDVEPPPPPVPRRQKSTGGDQELPLSRDLLGYDLGGFLVSSNILQHHDITHVLNSVNNDKNNGDSLLKEFQGFLEDQINSELNNSNPKYPTTVKLLNKLDRSSEPPEDKLEDISIDLVESDSSNKSSDMDDCFDPEFEKIEKTDVEESRDIDSLPSSSEAESVVEGSDQLGSMIAVKTGAARMGRRESIEDVDSWFKNHIPSNMADEQIIGLRKQRRGSDGFAYDTTRQYPFGEVRRRHDSQSAEMFEDITKLHDLGSEEKADTKPQHSTVTDDRIRNRRGSDGLVFYDTSRKFPFGEPNVNLPKAIEKEMANQKKTNNELKESTTTNTSYGQNVEKQKVKEQEASTASSDHSTLLKFLSKENLMD
ncbi:uncharacterized protein LOC135714340 [Ochlerotatus camptorhynchus]|uniref:uncharacterized protein LOC135714340 n=1 Tax=Ochlerotatus camptorhynchus TaxID=644619 RepID=UPI0031E28C51